MSPDQKPPRRSFFAALHAAEEPAAPARPAEPPPRPSLPTQAQSFAPAPAPAPEPRSSPKDDERIAALERRLQESQTQAIEAMVRYNEREEAQKSAQREIEETLRKISSQRRDEELDKQMREQLAGQRRRIEELEERLLRASDEGGAEVKREREAGIERARATAADLADLARRVEAASASAGAAANSAESSRRRVDEAAAASAALAQRVEGAANSANAAELSAEHSRRLADEAAAEGRAASQAGARFEAALAAVDERVKTAISGIAAKFEVERAHAAAERDEALRAARERDGAARALESAALRTDLEEIRRDAARRIEAFAARLDAASADAASAQRASRDSIETAIAETRAAGEAARAAGEAARAAGEAGRAAGEAVREDGKAVVAFRARVEASAQRSEQILRAAAEQAALDRSAFEGRVAAAVAGMTRFETEIRGIILSRILRLEEESRRESGSR